MALLEHVSVKIAFNHVTSELESTFTLQKLSETRNVESVEDSSNVGLYWPRHSRGTLFSVRVKPNHWFFIPCLSCF